MHKHTHAGIEQFLRYKYLPGLGLAELRVEVIGQSIPFHEYLFLEWKQGRALLVLDALDEESSLRRREEGMLAALRLDRQGIPRVLMTSRPVSDDMPSEFQRFERQEFVRYNTGRET